MEIETWWDCIFVLTNGRIHRGAIPQKCGVELAEEIFRMQRRQGRERQNVVFTIVNTLDGSSLECKDLLYTEIDREVE